MDDLSKSLEKFKNNPILKEFMGDENHKKLLIEYINNPTFSNQKKLDEGFRKFYFEIRFTAYILSLIRFASIDFDKRVRRLNLRSALILDENDNSTLLGGSVIEPELNSTEIEEMFSNPILFKAVQRLTKKEKEVLLQAYLMEMPDTQIAHNKNVSQQAVSKLRTKALKKIRDYASRKKD
ncbi:sigma-70 family RNA polymerase sigma factor [Paenibacillus silvae]|uniref:sigma-70 family RNA polymerase sigma factor n=1 Tax=Paenibacillus TaxID=44249 RepID=UPI001C124F91|nr:MULTISPECIES: sigma-70 family RNA polymerase sigma factor [Paenibacillus]MBU5356060.1 sigma-70 family RNA polymerase sigma factor [Paenibacillus barcinonensis]MDM5280067.1 sigma-70 family RNA polymerase sigma factor [Paenibacillus silvae]